jgi:electron transfer flavoprotein alpha subunit
MSMVLAVTEIKDGGLRKVSLEVTSQARILADAMGAKVTALVIAGPESAIDAAGLGTYGADAVLLAADTRLAVYHGEYFKQVVTAALEHCNADVVLFPATSMGRDLAPRVAAAKGAALASDCIGLSWKEGGLAAQKPLYAGKVVAEIFLQGGVQMASLRPNVFAAQQSRPGQNAPVSPLPSPALAARVVLKEVRKRDNSRMDVSDADVIVCGGRGMRAAENFGMLEEIAELLNGAVGATRAVVDAGWRPHSEQVGQTGKVVSPNLYIMCGASGSIQHWAGMSGSKCIVAINKDPNAPILQRADYSIVGDLFEIVPALKEEIKKLRG